MIKVAKPMIGEEEIDAAVAVLRSGEFISGKKVEEFEEKFAKYIGTKYAVACNSCTAALHMVYLYCGLGPNTNFIVPSMSFFSTISAGLMCGADPNFIDVDLRCNMSKWDSEVLLDYATKAIVPVHLYGNPCDIDIIVAIGEKYDIPVIEDCAQAIGAEYAGKKVGSFGYAGCFSFFATKNMTTLEGGMITTDDEALYKAAKKMRSHGMTDRNTHSFLGFNYRMTELNAAIGIEQLQKLDKFNTIRREFSMILRKEIENRSVKHFDDDRDVKNVYFWYPVFVPGKALEFAQHLTKNDIEFRHRYLEPLYRQPIFRGAYADLNYKNAERFSGDVFGLPNHPDLTGKEVNKIVDVVNDFNLNA